MDGAIRDAHPATTNIAAHVEQQIGSPRASIEDTTSSIGHRLDILNEKINMLSEEFHTCLNKTY